MPSLLQTWKKQLQQGNTQPLEILFTEHGRYCIKRLQQLGCSGPDAEDILQDAVLLFRHNLLANKLTHQNNLRGYLFMICYNLHRTRRQQAPAISLSETYPSEEDIKDHSVREEAMEAFQLLSPKCQDLISRYYVDRQSMSEIADALQLANADVAKATKFRCVQCWMKQLRQWQQEKHYKKAVR